MSDKTVVYSNGIAFLRQYYGELEQDAAEAARQLEIAQGQVADAQLLLDRAQSLIGEVTAAQVATQALIDLAEAEIRAGADDPANVPLIPLTPAEPVIPEPEPDPEVDPEVDPDPAPEQEEN